MAEGVEVGRAYVTILPNATGIASGIQSAVVPAAASSGAEAGSKIGGGILAGLKSFVGPIAALFAVNKIVDFFGDSVSAASDLAESTNKVQQVFKKATPAIMEFAGLGAKSLGLSQVAARDAAATFGIFGKSAKLTGGDLADFSTDMTGLAVDLASFHNTSPEEAIQAIGAALRGESEPIRKYGVLLDDATLRQQALKQGLISSTKEALTPQNRVLAAASQLFLQTKDAQGDFARTSNGLANQQRIAAAQWVDLQAKIGDLFLPTITSVMEFLTGTAIPGISSLVDGLSSLGSGASTLSANLAPVQSTLDSTATAAQGLLGALMGELSGYFQILQDVVAGLTERLQPAVPVITDIFNTIGGIISDVMSLITLVINTAMTVIMGLWNTYGQQILDVAGAVWNGVLGVIQPIMHVIQNVIQLVMNLIKGDWSAAWENVKGILQGVWDAIVGLVRGAVDIVVKVLSLAWSVVKGAVSSTWNSVVSTISGAVSSFTSAVSDGVNKVVQWFRELPGKLISAIGNVASKLTSVGRDMVEGIWSGISNGYSWITGKIRSWVGNVVDFFKKVFGIGSPSKVLAAEVGRWLGPGVINPIYDSLGDAERASQAMADAITPDLSGLASQTASGLTSGAWTAQSSTASVTYGNVTVEISLDDLEQFRTLVEFLGDIDRKVQQGVAS